jgi:hypothetical protein
MPTVLKYRDLIARQLKVSVEEFMKIDIPSTIHRRRAALKLRFKVSENRRNGILNRKLWRY